MAWVVLRSSHTTFVKETQDFGVALVTAGGRDVRLALWQRRDHDDRHADARRHARLRAVGAGRRAGHQRSVQLGRHGDAPERPLRVPAGVRRWRAAVLRLGVHPLHRCRRLRAGQHRHAERRGVPGRPAAAAGEAVPARRDQPGGLGHLRRQLPHPGAELGRPDRMPRGARQGGTAYAAPGAALWPGRGAPGDHAPRSTAPSASPATCCDASRRASTASSTISRTTTSATCRSASR